MRFYLNLTVALVPICHNEQLLFSNAIDTLFLATRLSRHSAIARALDCNVKVARLDLSRNSVCNLGAQELARMLCRNDALMQVNLKNNLIGDFGTRKLLLSLRKNRRVANRKLLLKNNRVSVRQTFQAREIKLKLGFSQQRTKITDAPMKITHR